MKSIEIDYILGKVKSNFEVSHEIILGIKTMQTIQ